MTATAAAVVAIPIRFYDTPFIRQSDTHSKWWSWPLWSAPDCLRSPFTSDAYKAGPVNRSLCSVGWLASSPINLITCGCFARYVFLLWLFILRPGGAAEEQQQPAVTFRGRVVDPLVEHRAVRSTPNASGGGGGGGEGGWERAKLIELHWTWINYRRRRPVVAHRDCVFDHWTDRLGRWLAV